MKNFVAMALGTIFALSVSTRDCKAAAIAFIANNGDFNTGPSWSDGNVPTNDGNEHFIQDSLTALFTSGSTSVTSLIVSDTSPGTLTMSGGLLTVAGTGDSFAIGRSLGGNGVVNLTNNAVLRTGTSFVGQRDLGVLNIGPTASVTSTGDWRVGQYGPSIDAGLAANGLVNVQGTFSAVTLYLGVDDGDGELRVSGTGSVSLSGQLVPNVNTTFPNRSALVHMIGSSASLSAHDLESENVPTQVRNRYLFQADSGGVSPITLLDAINITENRLEVDLTNFTMSAGSSLTLFNAAPNRIFGQFAEVNIIGANPSNFAVVYDQGLGDIQLVNTVPEPSAALLLGIGMWAILAKRRARSKPHTSPLA